MASMEVERLKEWLQDLLSTCEAGLPLSKVFTIFQEDFGQNFPSVNLGFPDSMKVIESFSDILIVETNPGTGEKVVSALNNQKFPILNFQTENLATCKEELPPVKPTSRLKPQRGTYQLTFLNHFQLEKTVLLDYFQSQSGFVGANIFSELKRRCFVYYKTEKDALNALTALKQNDNLYKLDVADDCKLNSDDYNKEMVVEEEEEEEIFPCMGSFQLTFTTTHFVNIPDVNQMFSEFGQLAEVCSNFRKVKGRTRVFIKYFDKINALGALKTLRHAFEDLSVAKCCLSPSVQNDVVTEDKDGLYCLTFKNSRRDGGELFSRGEIFQMFQQFGHVEALFMNSKLWAFIKFGRQEEAQAALKEFLQAQTLPQLGFSDNNSSVISKPAKFDIEETDSEIFIGNFPSKIGFTKLRRIFTNFQDITFRELKVNDKKAYSFAYLPSYEEIKRAVKELNGTVHFNRRLIVRHKVQSMQEQIERELLDEMNNDVGGNSWESDVKSENTDTLPDLVEDLDHVDHVADSPPPPVVHQHPFVPPQMERKYHRDKLSNESVAFNTNQPPPAKPSPPLQSENSRLITGLTNLNVNSPPDFTMPPPMLPKREDVLHQKNVTNLTRRPLKESFIQYGSSNEMQP